MMQTWRYYFAYTAVKERAKFPHGVPHGAEIVYALDTGNNSDKTRAVFMKQDREYARRVKERLNALISWLTSNEAADPFSTPPSCL
jgi:hypothetical protein